MVARISSRQPREISGSFGQEEPLGRRRAFVILREPAAATMILREPGAACGHPCPGLPWRRLRERPAMGGVRLAGLGTG